MTTINLYRDQQEKQKNKFSSSGLIFSVGIIIVTLLIFGGLKLTVSILSSQSEKLANSIQNEKNSLIGVTDVKKVIDMQTRLDYIKENLKINNGQISRSRATQILDSIGSEINPGIVIESYLFENNDMNKNKISLTFSVSNFSDLARQILSFKNSSSFTNLNITNISREKFVFCSIEMSIKS